MDWGGCPIKFLIWGGMDLDPASWGGLELGLKIWPVKTSSERQGCARLRFFGLTQLWLMWQSTWLNSDSTQIQNLLTWLNSDLTQIPNLLTWLNSDSTHLSQSWVKSDSRLITFYLILLKVADRGGGGMERPNEAECWFFPLWGCK